MFQNVLIVRKILYTGRKSVSIQEDGLSKGSSLSYSGLFETYEYGNRWTFEQMFRKENSNKSTRDSATGRNTH